MFAGIAGRYDLANHVLSFGADYWWRYRLARTVRREQPQSIVDLATGSGDVAFELQARCPDAQVTGLDFCQPMLDEAEAKKPKFDGGENIRFAFGDCMELPLADSSTDVVTIAFGVRNFEDRPRGLREMWRVLKPGGAAVILEFSQPYRWFRPFYYFYLKTILPLLAKRLTGAQSAYEYLGGTISDFPLRPELSAQIRDAGFVTVEARAMTFGIVALHVARK